MELKNKIEQYLETHTLKELVRYSGVSERTLKRIINGESSKLYNSTMDELYRFFKLEKDEFYTENFKKWNPETPSVFGNFIRNKRISKHMDMHELAKKVKIDKRALARIEAGESKPLVNSWTMDNMFEHLQFSDYEKRVTEKFIDAFKELERLVNKTKN